MDKIGSQAAEGSPAAGPRSDLLSQQVSEARYFFLGPGGRAACRPAFGGRETCNPDYLVSRRRYAYAGLEYVASGAGRVTLGSASAALQAGTVFAYGRETPCEIRTDPARPMVKYFVCLAGSGVGRRLAAAGVPPGAVRQIAAHAEVRSVFEDLIREGRRHGPVAGRIGAALLELLLLKIEDAAGMAARPGLAAEERFLRCKALIDANLERAVTLEEIAAAAGLEVSSICRLFRRFQGTSPYQYLLRRRMNLAAEHLVESGGPVKEAALRVGFADPYHFSRCFKAVHGVPPRELLRHRRER